MKVRSPLEALAQTPRRFGFDAAVRVLTLARHTDDPAEVAHFRSPPGMTYPPADVVEFRANGPRVGKPDVTVAMIGLTGPSGVLPRHYTDSVVQALRNRSSSLHAFLDTLSHRFVAFFARAGAKYRPARAAEAAALRTPAQLDPLAKALLALTGHGTAHLTDRVMISTGPLLHYAGLFALRPRSAERLGVMVSDWLGMRVEVIEFAGAWLSLPPDQRSRIGAYGQFSQLSLNAAAGVRAWDPQARIILRIGPLDRAGFERLLPDRLALQRLVSLVRTYVGFEIGFAINPVLAMDSVPPLQLDATADPKPRLGWNTWLEPMAGGRRRTVDAADSVFEAEIIEAQPPATTEVPGRVTPAVPGTATAVARSGAKTEAQAAAITGAQSLPASEAETLSTSEAERIAAPEALRLAISEAQYLATSEAESLSTSEAQSLATKERAV